MKLHINDNNEANLSVKDDSIALRTGDTINIGTSDYDRLSNKPSIEGTELQGDMSLDDINAYTQDEVDLMIGSKADASHTHTKSDITDFSHTHTKSQITDFPTIPTKVSQLTNDSGYLTEELEPAFNGSEAANITEDDIYNWNNKADSVQDLGYIDSSEYEDDREVFFNTLLDDGAYRFIWGDGDDYEYYLVVESMLDSGYAYQKYWYSEEGSYILYHCSLIVEDGEVIDRSEENYMTLTDASIMFAIKSHSHYDSKNDAMSVFDWCDSNALTFDNTKPFIVYTDTLNDKNWIIERYTTLRSPNLRFIKVYDMSDPSCYYVRSASYSGSSTNWGNWEEYKSGGTKAFTVTLSSASWSSNAQTVTSADFIATGFAYVVSPASASYANYTSAQIYADDVTTNGQMTFHCTTTPTANITVNIMRASA